METPYSDYYGIAENKATIFTDILNRKGWFICRPLPNQLLRKCIEVCYKNKKHIQANGGQVRAPLCNSQTFLELAVHPRFLRIKNLINKDSILNQQNLLYLSKNNKRGHEDQSRWHRDMPYLKWIPNQLAIFNALLCINKNSQDKVHSLDIVEGSHSFLEFPFKHLPASQIKSIFLKNGDMLIMNSFLYHRAPIQITNDFFLVNSVLTPRCFKQQVNYQEHLSVQKTSFQNAELCTYLGLNDMFKNPGYLEE